jgi:hypothetical protein
VWWLLSSSKALLLTSTSRKVHYHPDSESLPQSIPRPARICICICICISLSRRHSLPSLPLLSHLYLVIQPPSLSCGSESIISDCFCSSTFWPHLLPFFLSAPSSIRLTCPSTSSANPASSRARARLCSPSTPSAAHCASGLHGDCRKRTQLFPRLARPRILQLLGDEHCTVANCFSRQQLL